MHIARQCGWFGGALSLRYERLLHFLRLVEVNYRPKNHYHCSAHAADVAQAMFAFMHEPGVSCLSLCPPLTPSHQ